jgi:hypothetical protein
MGDFMIVPTSFPLANSCKLWTRFHYIYMHIYWLYVTHNPDSMHQELNSWPLEQRDINYLTSMFCTSMFLWHVQDSRKFQFSLKVIVFCLVRFVISMQACLNNSRGFKWKNKLFCFRLHTLVEVWILLDHSGLPSGLEFGKITGWVWFTVH